MNRGGDGSRSRSGYQGRIWACDGGVPCYDSDRNGAREARNTLLVASWASYTRALKYSDTVHRVTRLRLLALHIEDAAEELWAFAGKSVLSREEFLTGFGRSSRTTQSLECRTPRNTTTCNNATKIGHDQSARPPWLECCGRLWCVYNVSFCHIPIAADVSQ